jgi:O-antigen ligase
MASSIFPTDVAVPDWQSRRSPSDKVLALGERAAVIVIVFALSGGLLPLLQSDTPAATNLFLEGDPFIRAVGAAIYLIIFAFMALRLPRYLRQARLVPAIWILMGFAFLSALWSQSPEVTLRRSAALCVTEVVALFISARFDLHQQLGLFRLGFELLLVGSVLAVLFLPGIATSPEASEAGWRGILPHKNALGATAAIGVLLEWSSEGGNWLAHLRKYGGLVLALVLLWFSQSVTAQLSLIVVGVALQFVKPLRWKLTSSIPLLITEFLAAVVIVGLILYNFETVTGFFGRNSNLSGRRPLWEFLGAMILRHPWIGYGFGAFWAGGNSDSETVGAVVGWTPWHSHNGYLEVLLNLGIIGLGLFFISCLGTMRNLVAFYRSRSSVAHIWPVGAIVFILFSNMAECSIVRQNNILWVLFLTIQISLAGWKKTSSSQGPPQFMEDYRHG